MYKASDKNKDQSYFLYQVSKEVIPHILFPLNKFTVGTIVCVLFVSGFLITFLASLTATSRYIRMKTNKLYEI